MSTSDFEECINEEKCHACGQVPIYIINTGSGHQVCDYCTRLWTADTGNGCPIPSCTLPSHLARKIIAIKEDLEKANTSKNNENSAIFAQIANASRCLDELSANANGTEAKVKNVGTEVSKAIQEVKMESSKDMKMDGEFYDELRSKVKDLMTNVRSLEMHLKEQKEQVEGQAETNTKLKMENEKTKEENGGLKKSLRKIKYELEGFRLSVKLNTNEMNENMFMMDHSLPQSDILPMSIFNLLTQLDKFQPVFTWNIKGLKEKLESKVFKEWSDLFQWAGYPIKARIKLESKEDNCIHISMCLEEVNTTEERDLKCPPGAYFVLKNKNPRGTHKIKTMVHSKIKAGKLFSILFDHKSWFTDKSFNVDDSVSLEVYMESPEMTQRAYSRVGTLNWAIEGCEEKLSLEKQDLLAYHESPYFYTGPKGYRVQVLLGLNGLEEYTGKGPSAYVRFLNGEYDDDLPGSFSHRTTITLSNPKDPKFSVVKTINNNRPIVLDTCYRIDMCEANRLPTLIQDDTLYVRVDIVKTIQ